MGAWSYYDDGSDRTADFAADIEDAVLPESIKKMESMKCGPCTPAKKNCQRCKTIQEEYDVRAKYMVSNPQKVYKALQKERKRDPKDMTDSDIAGVAIYLARGWGSTHIMNRSPTLPRSLPKKFPVGLRKLALSASKRQLKATNTKEAQELWFDIKPRIAALKDQVRFFTL